MKVLIAILCLCVGVFAQSSVDSARANRQKSAKILTTKKPAESSKKADSIKQKKADSVKQKKVDSTKQNRQNRTKTLTTKKATTPNVAKKSAVKITKSKQRRGKIDFFVGVQLGIDAINMQEISAKDRKEDKKEWVSGSASFGAKGGIVSEEKVLGGRFYAELSYAKIPKFNALNVGVDLDLLINYYEAQRWKIGGFLGIGGGMNLVFVADSTLQKEGEKSLIAVGWANIGLVRFLYYHRTGVHSVELNAKIAFVTPTIYSLKNAETGITTSYKASSNGVMMSYIYQF